MHFTLYGCISTGHERGLIEMVPNTKTTAEIQVQYGGGGVTSALKKTPISDWLQVNNTENVMHEAVEKFTLSSAAYSVATYVLGIGDRHNDNIMVDKNGLLFRMQLFPNPFFSSSKHL